MGPLYSSKYKTYFLRAKSYAGPIILLFSLSTIACTYSLRERNERENAANLQKVVIGKPTIPTNMQLPGLHTIEDIVLRNPDFGGVKRSLQEQGATGYLKELGTVTLLLPVGAELDSGTLEFLEEELKNKGNEALLDILREHSLERRIGRAELVTWTANKGGFALCTLTGDSLRFGMESEQLYVETKDGLRSRIVIMDQRARDGVIHGIDHWLLPTMSVPR